MLESMKGQDMGNRNTCECDQSSCMQKIKKFQAECWWLTPVILATCEAEIGRIPVQDQPGQTVCETPRL
jgi:hypothetical protein